MKKADERLEKYIKEGETLVKAIDEKLEKFIEEMKADRKDMNKKWGDLANKMGTLVEDLIAPASGPVIEKYFGCQYLDITERRRKRFNDGRNTCKPRL